MQHHVYFWLKEENKTAEARAELEKGLDLCKTAPSVASGNWGVPAATKERPVTDKSWDYSLYLSFDSIEDHNAYQVHPNHDAFVATCKDFWEKVIVMDVE